METPFELILFSAEQNYPDEIKILRQLFEQGLEIFHLRKPVLSLQETKNFLEAVPAEFHNRIVLHSHFQLTGEFKVKGIHFNESNRKLIAQFGKYPVVSTSFHSLQDLKENTFPYKYVFLSPIFDSISKTGYKSGFDLKLLAEELRTLKKNSLPKIIALGGINKKNIASVEQAAFSGAALLGAVWQSENPVKTFLEIQDLLS